MSDAAGTQTATATATGADGGGNASANPNAMSATYQPSNDAAGTSTTAQPDRNWLPEEYRTHPTFQGISDVAALAKGYEQTQKLVGAKVLAKPGEGAPAEQVSAYRKAIGVPDAVTGYKIPAVTIADDPNNPNMKGDIAASMNKYAAKLHELGAPAEVADGIMAFYMEDLQANLAAAGEVTADQKAQKNDADDAAFAATMQTKFGADSQKVHSVAQSLLGQYVPAEYKAAVDSMSNDQLLAVTVMLNSLAGDFISEDKMPKQNHDTTRPGTVTHADQIKLQQERYELMKDPYKNKTAIDEINEKIKRAYGR